MWKFMIKNFIYILISIFVSYWCKHVTGFKNPKSAKVFQEDLNNT